MIGSRREARPSQSFADALVRGRPPCPWHMLRCRLLDPLPLVPPRTPPAHFARLPSSALPSRPSPLPPPPPPASPPSSRRPACVHLGFLSVFVGQCPPHADSGFFFSPDCVPAFLLLPSSVFAILSVSVFSRSMVPHAVLDQQSPKWFTRIVDSSSFARCFFSPRTNLPRCDTKQGISIPAGSSREDETFGASCARRIEEKGQ